MWETLGGCWVLRPELLPGPSVVSGKSLRSGHPILRRTMALRCQLLLLGTDVQTVVNATKQSSELPNLIWQGPQKTSIN